MERLQRSYERNLGHSRFWAGVGTAIFGALLLFIANALWEIGKEPQGWTPVTEAAFSISTFILGQAATISFLIAWTFRNLYHSDDEELTEEETLKKPQDKDEAMTGRNTSYEIIETIGALSNDALTLDQGYCSCTPEEHEIPAGIHGMFNTLAWGISVEDNYEMVDGALPLFGYLMGTEGADEVIERMGRTHPEVTQLIMTLRSFCPKGREKG